MYLGAMVLAGTGGLLLYRLEIVSARQDSAALSQITFAIAGIAFMASAAFSVSVPRFLEKRRIGRELKKETRKSDCDVQKQDTLEEELSLALLKGWEIYDFFQKNAWASLNIPTMSLGLLLVLFLVQLGLESETGIHLVAFNLQPVLPALVVIAAVLAYGTAEDLAVGEGEASGFPERPSIRQHLKHGGRIWRWTFVKHFCRLSIYQWRLLHWK